MTSTLVICTIGAQPAEYAAIQSCMQTIIPDSTPLLGSWIVPSPAIIYKARIWTPVEAIGMYLKVILSTRPLMIFIIGCNILASGLVNY